MSEDPPPPIYGARGEEYQAVQMAEDEARARAGLLWGWRALIVATGLALLWFFI